MSNYQSFGALQAGLGAAIRLKENENYVYNKFRDQVLVFGADYTTTMDTADASINFLQVGKDTFQYRLEQINTTVPVTSADGLAFVTDGADNDGFELGLGRTLANGSTEATNSKGAFTIGGPAFFLRVKLDIGTVANSDNICVGFSKGVHVADGFLDTETDAIALNVDQGQVNIEEILNNAGNVTTDTTVNWTDAQQKVLEVRINEAGNSTFFVDDVQYNPARSAVTLDSGDVVHAMLQVLVDASAADPAVSIMEWESGYLRSRGLASISDSLEGPQDRLG